MNMGTRCLLLVSLCACAGPPPEAAVGLANACRVRLLDIDVSEWREVSIPGYLYCVPSTYRPFLQAGTSARQSGGWQSASERVQWLVGPFRDSDLDQLSSRVWTAPDTIAGLPVLVEERQLRDGYSFVASRPGLILTVTGHANGSLRTARAINRTVRSVGGA